MTLPTLELLPDPVSPRLARGFVRRVLGDAGIDALTIEDAALLVTELVTNSVLHASTDITLDVVVESGSIRVGVTDALDAGPVLREQDQDATTGRGLYLVDKVATAWSVVYAKNSKTVEFSLTTLLADPHR